MAHLLAVLDACGACRHALRGSEQNGHLRPGQPLLTMHACMHAYAVLGGKLKVGTGAAPAASFIWTSKAAQAHPIAGRVQLDFVLAHGLPVYWPLPAGGAGSAVAGRAPAVARRQLALVRQHIFLVSNGCCGAASRGIEAWPVPAAERRCERENMRLHEQPWPARWQVAYMRPMCTCTLRLQASSAAGASIQNSRAARHGCSRIHSPYNKLHRAARRVAAPQAGGVGPHNCVAVPARGWSRVSTEVRDQKLAAGSSECTAAVLRRCISCRPGGTTPRPLTVHKVPDRHQRVPAGARLIVVVAGGFQVQRIGCPAAHVHASEGVLDGTLGTGVLQEQAGRMGRHVQLAKAAAVWFGTCLLLLGLDGAARGAHAGNDPGSATPALFGSQPAAPLLTMLSPFG